MFYSSSGTHPHVEEILSKWKLESLESRPVNSNDGDDKSSLLKSKLFVIQHVFVFII